MKTVGSKEEAGSIASAQYCNITIRVSDPGTVKDLTPSPALKPMPPIPHWMSAYMKKTNDFSPSVDNTT